MFAIGDAARVTVEVVEGRARVAAEEPAEPTVLLGMPVTTFAALVGGRSDVPDDVTIDGDETLGRAVVAGMAFMP